jgi:internalin A
MNKKSRKRTSRVDVRPTRSKFKDPKVAFAEAERRIRLAKETRATRLDLNFLRLREVPQSVTDLQQLESLELFENELTSIPESVGNLVHLRRLEIGDNWLTSVPKSIGRLIQLRYLALNINNLRTVPAEIGALVRLEQLYLNSNQLRSLPDSFEGLGDLRTLWLAANPLRELPASIRELRLLQELDLSSCRFRTIPPSIRNLARVEVLNLSDNELDALPDWLKDLGSLRILSLSENPSLALPPEITGSEEKPSPPAGVLDYYFRTHRLIGEQRALREFKMILVGRGEVGKSSLVDALHGKPFVPGKPPTEGIMISDWQIDLPSGSATAHVWDFGGQEIMHGTHQFFLTHRSLYLVVLDGRGDRQNREAEYWLKYVRAFGGDSPVFVVLNKQAQHAYDTDREKLSRKYGVPLDHFFRTDCSDSSSTDRLRAAIIVEANAMLSFGELFPTEFWPVKERLSEMRANGEDYLSEEQYRSLFQTAGMTEDGNQEYAAVLQWLTDLGTVVSFPEDIRLSELTVLNPEWVTDGIYRVLNDTRLRDQKQGELAIEDLRRILPSTRWPRNRHRYLIALMQKFELCFPLEGAGNAILVPELLPDREPPLHDWHVGHCLVFLYRYPVLPHGVLPRFITRTHEYSRNQERWRSGVVLGWQAAQAIVRADYDANEVAIWIRGSHADLRRDLLSLIRSHFDTIHSRIEGLIDEIDERVAVPENPDVTLSFKDLLLDERDGRATIRVTVSGKRIEVAVVALLNGVEAPEKRAHRVPHQREDLSHSQVHHHHYAPNTQPTFSMGDEIKQTFLGGTFQGPVAGKMQECVNLISTQVESGTKQLLQRLQKQAAELIQKLPAEKQDEASDNLMLLVNSATAPRPRRPWYSVSAQGLLEASKFAKDFTGNLAGTIGQLGKLLWPGFELTDSGPEESGMDK